MKYSKFIHQRSESLHDKAVRWGFTEIPGRPFMNGSSANLYVDEPVSPTEVLSPDFNKSAIGLFQLNGFWGYTISVRLAHSSTGYMGFLMFCDPYSTHREALEAAVESVLKYIHRDVPRTQEDEALIARLDKWAHSLLMPQQLTLWI